MGVNCPSGTRTVRCVWGRIVRDQLERGTRHFRMAGLVVCAAVLRAERTPIQVYATTDGLAQSTIHGIHHDRRGFLWFGTSEGLSRYDGYEFITFRETGRHDYKTAATELGVSVNTVSFHMRKVYDKLQVHSKSETVAEALRDHLA